MVSVEACSTAEGLPAVWILLEKTGRVTFFNKQGNISACTLNDGLRVGSTCDAVDPEALWNPSLHWKKSRALPARISSHRNCIKIYGRERDNKRPVCFHKANRVVKGNVTDLCVNRESPSYQRSLRSKTGHDRLASQADQASQMFWTHQNGHLLFICLLCSQSLTFTWASWSYLSDAFEIQLCPFLHASTTWTTLIKFLADSVSIAINWM